MKRMKSLTIYMLGIIGFIILSLIMEDALIAGTHKKIKNEYVSIDSSYGLEIEDAKADASSHDGTMEFTLKNNTDKTSEAGYLKVDLISDRGNEAITQFIEIPEMEPGESKAYKVKFKGNNIKSYKMAMVDSLPNKENIIDVFGWEVDSRNVFGFDLSEKKLFGKKIKDLFSWKNSNVWSKVKQTSLRAISLAWGFTRQIPWWGYAIGAMIIIYYAPKGYIFGLF